MNIIEAVQALKDGLCDGIKRESWSGTILSLSSGIIRQYNGNDTDNIRRAENLIGDDWQLVNPKPQTETVEVKRWAKLDKNGNYHGGTFDKAQAERWSDSSKNSFIVELTGTYEKPVKPKVKHREQVFGFEGHFAGGSTFKFSGKYNIFAEWTE